MKKNNLCSTILLWLFAALLSFSFNSCSDQKMSPQSGKLNNEITSTSTNNNSSLRTSPVFVKTVGAPIDRTTATRWMNNFSSKNKGAIAEYFISASAVGAILSDSSCIGISLQRAIDTNGRLHIIPIGIDATGKFIATNSLTTDNAVIDWVTAWQWINNYKGEVRSNYFGSITFNRLLISQQAKAIRLSLALNDKSVEQILLSDASVSSPSSYQDESIVCPPVCPQ